MSQPRARTGHEVLQEQVTQLLKMTGWSHLHIRKSIGKGRRWVTTTNVVGWPDCLCWSARQPGRHIGIEIKIPPDRLRPEQEQCRDELLAAGFEFYVVTPADLEDLAQTLRPRRG